MKNSHIKPQITITCIGSTVKIDNMDIIQYISSGASATYFLVRNEKNRKIALSICQNNASNRTRVKIQELISGIDGVVQQIQWYIVNKIEIQDQQNNSSIFRKVEQALNQYGNKIIIILYEYYEGSVLGDGLLAHNNSEHQRPQSLCSSRSESFYLNQNEKQQTLQIFMSILSIVQRLHEAGVYHFDLKPENILINNMKVIIVDFGSAKYFPQKQKTKNETYDFRNVLSNVRGTLVDGYVILDPFIDLQVNLAYPTEVTQAFSSTRYDKLGEYTQLIWCEKYDVYSLGCILYNMLTGQFLRSSLAKDSSKYIQILQHYGIDLANLISLMTYRDPMIRLTIQESIKILLEILKCRIINYGDSSIVSYSGTDEVVHTNSHSNDDSFEVQQSKFKRQILGQSPNDHNTMYKIFSQPEGSDDNIQPPRSRPPNERKNKNQSSYNIKKYLLEIIVSRRRLALKNLKRRMKYLARAQSQQFYTVFTGKSACIYDDMQYLREENVILHGKIQPPRRISMLYYNNLFKDLALNGIIEFSNKQSGTVSKSMIDFFYHVKYLIRVIQLETIKQLYTADIQSVEEVNFSQFEHMSDFSDSSSKVEMDVDESKLSQTSILVTTRSMTMEMMTNSGFLNPKSRSNSFANLYRLSTFGDVAIKNTLSIIEASVDASMIDDKQQIDNQLPKLETDAGLLDFLDDPQGAIYELSLLSDDDITTDGY